MPRTHSQRGGGRKPRLSSLLEQEISQFIKTEMELPGIISVSHVDVSPNMQGATVWLSIYGADEDEVLKELKRETGALRKYLTKHLVSKYIPQIFFKVDISEEHADTISKKLKELE